MTGVAPIGINYSPEDARDPRHIMAKLLPESDISCALRSTWRTSPGAWVSTQAGLYAREAARLHWRDCTVGGLPVWHPVFQRAKQDSTCPRVSSRLRFRPGPSS